VQAAAYRDSLTYPFDIEACAVRLEALGARAGDRTLHGRLQLAAQAMRRGVPCDWKTLLHELRARDLPLAQWDQICFAATCTEANLAGAAPLLDDAL
jgi:hypothetical protein